MRGLGVLIPLFAFQVLWANCNAMHQDFLKCMATHPTNKTSSQYIYTPNSPLYTSLLQSSQQNPRWMNSTTTQNPLFIIIPYTQSQIQAALFCTRKHGFQLRVRSGGHDYEGLSYICKTGHFVLIDLINLRSITINMEDESAWIQSGATLGELYYAIANKSKIHGFPAGICPSVGVGGHFSGGGMGTILRKYGLAADNIIDACFIDVYGRILDRKTMGEDLFWAIRGGGGASFGIIVSWKLKLVRVPSLVTVFSLHKKLEQGAIKLVHRWQYIADKLPKSLFIRLIIQNVDGDQESKQTHNTVQAIFNSIFLGGTGELIAVMNKSFPELGLRAENCTEMTWIESVLYFAGYFRGEPLEVLLNRTTLYKSNFKAKSDFVKEPISEQVLEGIWERFHEEDFVFMMMDPFGGRMNEISEYELPFPHRKGNIYNIQYLLKWGDVNETSKHLEWIRMLYKFMRPYVSRFPRAAYLNYRDLDLGIRVHVPHKGNFSSYSEAKIWGKKYFKGNFRRLARIKTKVDPENFFRNEQSIPLLPTAGNKSIKIFTKQDAKLQHRLL